jgi:hypothetical protein
MFVNEAQRSVCSIVKLKLMFLLCSAASRWPSGFSFILISTLGATVFIHDYLLQCVGLTSDVVFKSPIFFRP